MDDATRSPTDGNAVRVLDPAPIIDADARAALIGEHAEGATPLPAARYLDAIDHLDEAIALFDPHARLVRCNGAFRSLIGDRLDGDVVGRSYEELLDAWIPDIELPDAVARARFRADRLTRFARVHSSTSHLRMRDGRQLRVRDQRTLDGGTVKTVWDITEDARVTEDLLRARAEADAASGAKSDFLASLSHELRTPLNAILGFAQLMLRDAKAALPERQQERARLILRGGEHLLCLINDILDLSHIEAGAVSISPASIDVGELLAKVHATLEPIATAQGVRVVIPSVARDTPTIAADPTRLFQILVNLGSNAIKYNRPAGVVTLDVCVPAPALVRIAVRDTGIGIPENVQDKVFHAFERAGQQAGPIEGTGLGLTVSRRLAHLMHGDLGFRSRSGEGSEFWVDMPVHAPAAA